MLGSDVKIPSLVLIVEMFANDLFFFLTYEQEVN